MAKYDAWWLADPHDGLYAAASTLIVRVANGAAGRFIGQELDGAVAYNFSRQFQFGGGFGHIFPGAFLNNATPGESYNYPYASDDVGILESPIRGPRGEEFYTPPEGLRV